MPLTLMLGPANSAKAGEVLGAYAAATSRGALLVVPNTQDARHYSRELAGHGSVLGPALTFSGLCFEIARRVGYRARRLSPLQRERLLARAVSAARLEALAEAAEHRGFVAAAGELISELERSLITPQRFASAMRAWARADERRAAYASDVASIYLSYARELDRLGWVDRDLYAWRALDALRGAPGRWGSAPVFFYGFDDLHPLQRDAVETLSSVVGVEVTVSLTYEAGRMALAARAEVVEELRPLADRVLELPALDEHYSPTSRAALHHLERSLFESSPDALDPGSSVRLLEAGGQRAEAELLAAEVRALLAAEVPAEEIAIVYRSPRAVAPLLERVFRQYDVPLSSDYELPFGQTTLGRAVLALARCAFEPADTARAADLLTYLRAPGVLDQIELADALELTVRRGGLRSATQAREHFQRRLGEVDSLAGAPDPASELARHGRRLLAAPALRTAPVLDRDGELDARALAAMLRALDEVAELGEAPSGSELIELLERIEVRAGHTAPGAVLLSAPLEIRARRFRAVLVGGLQESEFPAGSTTEPFFSPELRRELASSSGLALRPGDDGLVRERYLFYSAISRATDQLVLSYRSSDEEGNLALPSPFIADVAELLDSGWPQRRRRRLLADVLWPDEEAPTERERARSAAESGDAARREPAPLRLTDTALRHARHTEIVSGGALECYAACPVKWLVERELAPKRFEPDPEPILRGTYMHGALEEILRRLGGPITPPSLPRALSILEQVVAELPARIAPASGHAVRGALLQGIEADLRRYLAHEATDGCDWQPAALELRFGFDDEQESLPALELGDGVRVRGAIDRVDLDREGRQAIVRDYKSGAFRPGYQAARWVQDRQLQVALYMLAVRELMGVEPVAGLYQPLRGPDLRARGMFLEGTSAGSCLVANDARDQECLGAELEQSTALAVELAGRLRSGELVPSPPTCSRDGCAYPGICRSR